MEELDRFRLVELDILLNQVSGIPKSKATRITKKIATEINPWIFFKNATSWQMEDAGFTATQALQLCAAIALGKHCAFAMPAPDLIVEPAIAAAIFQQMIGECSVEKFAVLVLDIKNHLLAKVITATGGVAECIAAPREIFGAVIWHGGSRCVVAHNHPSGDLTPSPEDLALTRALISGGKILHLELQDHIIVTAQSFKSLRTDTNLWNESDKRSSAVIELVKN